MQKHPEINNTSSITISKQKLQTLSGTLHSNWEENAPFTLNGYLSYFAEYLHVGGIFADWCNECPLEYKSNNAPKTSDVLGTAIISILSGHNRYSHTASLFGDNVAAEVMGLNKIVSHDSLSRGLAKMDESLAEKWMQKHLIKTYEPLLAEPYVLDVDPTIKQIYGHQEGSAIGYNPTKPGRPSLCYHTYFVANIRLVLDVDVRRGNETAGCHSHPRLWSLLDSLPENLRPAFVRGDIGFGNEGTMVGCEEHKVNYLFKLRQSPKIKTLLKDLTIPGRKWVDDADGWRSFDTTIRLDGWSKERRIVVYRRQKRSKNDLTSKSSLLAEKDQLELPLAIVTDDEPSYEWRVLVTDLDYYPEALGQLYRDRADCENIIDEMKNQWGWGGFMSRELKNTQLMARIVSLVYNWWNIFCRLANPNKHMEAITSRPALQNVIGRLVKTGGQRIVHLCATGDTAQWATAALTGINAFIRQILNATQLKQNERWCQILRQAFRVFLGNRQLQPVSDGDQLLLLT